MSNWCFDPFLKRGVILPILKAFGILPEDKHKLIRWFSGFAMLNAVSFKNPGGRLSIPDAFLRFNFLSCLNVSFTVTGVNLNVV